MRKLVLSALFFLPALLFAECLSLDEAQSIAEEFFSNAQPSMYKSAAETSQVNLVWDGEEPVYRRSAASEEASTVNDPSFYVFNKDNGKGFVIVSGESETVQPILGYSLDNSFEVDNMPANLYYWMMSYRQEIQSARENLSATNFSTTKKVGAGPTEPIKLMETAKWDQDAPYNSQLPNYATGCSATALSIVMRYHQWPDKGVGTLPLMNTNIGLVQLGHTYDWTKMPIVYTDQSTSEENAQVGTLMRDVGVMLRSWYDKDGAGAMPNEFVPRFLPVFFKYDAKTIKSQYRKDFELATWHEMMKKELDENRPILYGGYDDTMLGHTFVLDGYAADNHFHVNWGWSGFSNGYFLLTSMKPFLMPDNYRNYQFAVVGIQPDETNPGGGDYDLLEFSKPKDGGKFGLIVDRDTIEPNIELNFKLTKVVNRGTKDFNGKIGVAQFAIDESMKAMICQPYDLSQRAIHMNDSVSIPITAKVTLPIEEGDCISAVYQSPNEKVWRILYPGDTDAVICKYEYEFHVKKPTAVEEPVALTIRVMVAAGMIQVDGMNEMTAISVYSLNGQLVAATQAESAVWFELPAEQIYIVRVGEQSWKVKL